MSYQNNLDYALYFSNAQTIDNTSNAASTNEIDLGATGMGQGKSLKVVVNVTALTGTLVVKVCHKTASGVAVTDNVLTMPTTGSGSTGQYHFTLPQNVSRYVKLFYTAGTSATISSWITADPS